MAEPDNGHSVAVDPAIVGPRPHRAMLEKHLHVALKLHHVTVVHDVVLALLADLALGLRFRD